VVNGTVLTTLASFPVGSAKNFTTPDSRETAILVRIDNNTVKAFSNVCTHEGCEVSYSKSQTLLICPCHGAAFDPKSGNAVRRPARSGLKSFNVTVDASGNIIYTK
jgi:thiosulfate dehydrogenase [quinone] large subunit